MNFLAGVAITWFVLICVGCALAWLPPVRWWLSTARHALLLAVIAAVVARLVPALLPVPADAIVRYDIESYRMVADAVRNGRDVYDLTGRYPYLPLHMHIFAGASWLSEHTGLPFTLLVKLPEIAADMTLALLIGRAAHAMGRRDAGALAMVYALNPVSVLVTGYHGQFDAIPTVLVFGAWYVLAFGRGPWAAPASAFLFGLAVTDKTWPLLLAPVLLWRVPRRGTDVDAAIAAHLCYLAIAALPVIASFTLYEWLVPGGAHHAVRVASSYQGIVGTWGYSQLLVNAAGPEGRSEAIHLARGLGPWVLGSALACAALAAARLRSDADRLALLLAVTYTCAAGWGVHWLAWTMPAAVLAARKWSALFVCAATAYTSSIYLGFGGVLYGVVWITGSLYPLTWAATLNLWAWLLLAAGVGGTMVWIMGGRAVMMAARRALVVPARTATVADVDAPLPQPVAPAPSAVPARR
jgi:hypothetical protein